MMTKNEKFTTVKSVFQSGESTPNIQAFTDIIIALMRALYGEKPVLFSEVRER